MFTMLEKEGIIKMERNYTFEMFWEDLDNGFTFKYYYKNCQYTIYKLTQNCYKNELIFAPEKCPYQKNAIYTLKRVKELFPYMEQLEYDIGMA